MLGHFFDLLLTRFRIFPVGFVKILSHDSVVLDAVHIRLFTPRSFTIPGRISKLFSPSSYSVFETPRLRVRPWQESDAEIGYWIGKPYWNQGLGTEALREMVDWCFNKMGFLTLWSDFFADNPASGRIMEKCGFRDTGMTNYLSNLYCGDERPVKIMRLTAENTCENPASVPRGPVTFYH